jgi:hypothetical protein
MQSRGSAAGAVPRRTVVLLGAAGAAAVVLGRPALAGLGPELAKEGWQELTFKNKQPNSFTALEGGTGVRVESRGAVSLIYRPLQADLAATPVLAWRWRVDQAPPPTDLTRKGGEDRALAIYVAFEYDPARAGFVEKAKRAAAAIASDRPLPGRVLIYTWGGNGATRGWFDSPYIREYNKMKVLRGPEAPLGQWVEERVDLVADHQEAFGYPPTRPTELSLSCDSDDTKAPVAGAVADVAFRARG